MSSRAWVAIKLSYLDISSALVFSTSRFSTFKKYYLFTSHCLPNSRILFQYLNYNLKAKVSLSLILFLQNNKEASTIFGLKLSMLLMFDYKKAIIGVTLVFLT